MRYILIDERGNDTFTTEFDYKTEAVAEARKEWGRMTPEDRKRRTSFYILESINPDEDAEDHFDGNPVWTVPLK